MVVINDNTNCKRQQVPSFGHDWHKDDLPDLAHDATQSEIAIYGVVLAYQPISWLVHWILSQPDLAKLEHYAELDKIQKMVCCDTTTGFSYAVGHTISHSHPSGVIL